MGATDDSLAVIARGVLAGGPGERSVAARVVDIKGFSTWSGEELVVVDATGLRHGALLGGAGAAAVLDAAGPMLDGAGPGLVSSTVEVHGAAVAEAGLACGGRAELLLQPLASIPQELWSRLAARAAVAMLTRVDGAGSGPASQVVGAGGETWGSIEPPSPEAVELAGTLLSGGQRATRRVTDGAGTVLVEAWVAPPRLVVVGGGELVDALEAQGRLLGWDLQALDDRPDPGGTWPALGAALDWAGDSVALVVLSHDAHVDVPALAAGLARRLPYVGALGSRRTQSRRLERLVADGWGEADLERIRRPIGLDLGGRSAPEVALAVCAEILAVHCGRDGRPLRDVDGPIHDRPGVSGAPPGSGG